ncbi:MAG TPA: 2OG-Fe(II) oxygenase [Gammaproteobacteria bacterium]|jgi:SM-20-related protein
MNASPTTSADGSSDPGQAIRALVQGLSEQDWVCCPGFLPQAHVSALRREAEALRGAGRFHPAGIGHVAERRSDIRGDDIHWVEQQAPLARALQQQQLAELKDAINARLYLGLHDFEGHYAAYPSGGGYARHVDRFRGDSRRVLSVVLYLNDAWDPEDGGDLCLYAGEAAAEPVARISPHGGTLICFLSEHVPHEVLPTRRTRWSLSGWFRRRA